MKEYDLIAIGSGSAMNIVDAMLQRDTNIKVAVVDKDEPGGICLTRGCIPSKILLYPAELVRIIERANTFGIDLKIEKVDFAKVMKRMRTLIDGEIDSIRQGLTGSESIDYYHMPAEFVGPYTLKVGGETITSKMFLLCTGSKPVIPPIRGLEQTGYQTSDTILHQTQLPESVGVIGGGYIAAEYGHFLSAMGSKVAIIGRNRQFLPQEEPEVSALAMRELGRHMTILTNCEVVQAERTQEGKKKIVAVHRQTGETKTIIADEILVASGRGPNTDILHPEKAGIKTDEKGWISANEYLETSQPNVWAFGDADGRHLFKHVANYESIIVYYNAVMRRRIRVDYHAVPHAVFTYPEIASVGLKQVEAAKQYGEDRILIGFERYEDTAKGEAMDLKDYFVKVILERDSSRILGAHIIGPYASSLIQEIVNLMYTPDQSAHPLLDAMHIHPAMSEVVQRAFQSTMTAEQYLHLLQHHYQLRDDDLSR
jgi:dihydrolipoamide dehydrogenase